MMRALLRSLLVVSVFAGTAMADPAPSSVDAQPTEKAQVKQQKKHDKAKSKKARKKAAKQRHRAAAAKSK